MAKGQKSNRKIVPQSHAIIDQWKYEIAAEMGLPVGKSLPQGADAEFAAELGNRNTATVKEDYWGHIATRDTGAVGGSITRRLVQDAEKTLLGL